MQALREAQEYIVAGVPVGKYLADQLLLPLGIGTYLGSGGGHFVPWPFPAMPQLTWRHYDCFWGSMLLWNVAAKMIIWCESANSYSVRRQIIASRAGESTGMRNE